MTHDELLEEIINSNLQEKFNNIHVQFHKFVENSVVRREKIREILQKTHKLTYDFEFIWENWEKR